ncbi:hypothetical protein JR316_0002918 [Psilocybe cubensis]|uniref:Uncharacterized protein n=2 Tax=Psilocybe cubensis TaxID=181762 RepID=A0ACB8H6V9_PSICU|nr:hypothetical protein JR316_0002918 [Psilocybe cubensis]KAH9483450.1 hypothetical protein JR316_0002918 [Psilocybe cubensis]
MSSSPIDISNNLYLSSDEPWRATFTTEHGLSLYKTESSSLWSTKFHTKILRAIPSFQAQETSSTADVSLKDSFGLLADIEFHTFRSTIIRYDGKERSVDDFFRRRPSNMWGRKYVFTGHNGVEYVWTMEEDKCKLFIADSSNTLVTNYHRTRYGFMHETRLGYLELFGKLDNRTVDQIIVTFVYAERYRRLERGHV